MDGDSTPWKHARSVTTEKGNQGNEGTDKEQKSKLEPGKGAHSSQDYSREENQLEVSGAGSTQCKIKQ